MADEISVDVARANSVADKIQDEIDLARNTLQQVSELIERDPWEDDTVLNSMHQVGTEMNDLCNGIFDIFTGVISNLMSGLASLARAAADALDDVAKID